MLPEYKLLWLLAAVCIGVHLELSSALLPLKLLSMTVSSDIY